MRGLAAVVVGLSALVAEVAKRKYLCPIQKILLEDMFANAKLVLPRVNGFNDTLTFKGRQQLPSQLRADLFRIQMPRRALLHRRESRQRFHLANQLFNFTIINEIDATESTVTSGSPSFVRFRMLIFIDITHIDIIGAQHLLVDAIDILDQMRILKFLKQIFKKGIRHDLIAGVLCSSPILSKIKLDIDFFS